MDNTFTTLLNAQRNYFNSGITRTYQFRKEHLRKLKRAILQHELALQDALYKDLKKSAEEAYITETGFLLNEINTALSNLKNWMDAKNVSTNLLNFPSKSYILNEPLGVVLIIGPWNYPLQLLLVPLVGAIAAGNCAVLKPSEFAPATSLVMRQIIEETFAKEYILFIEGDGSIIVPELMNNFSFDHVFYTGSTTVGRMIYEMAAKRLVPVTLELGGKSPCVVESDAAIKVAAKRIAMSKFSNCGQMCVAPDYVLVHESKKDELIDALKQTIQQFFGNDASQSYDYGKIINEKQFDRIIGYLKQGNIVYGGKYDRAKLFIEPTIITDTFIEDSIMQEEIFGPVLPIITFTHFEQALSIVQKNKNPLAFYVFTSSSKKEQQWLNSVQAGGVCINNTALHLTNDNLPFGGRGFSGMGNYHGRFSFDTFSHQKAVMKTPTWFDPSMKYPSFKGKLGLLKWIFR